jgi:hypothetical protein
MFVKYYTKPNHLQTTKTEHVNSMCFDVSLTVHRCEICGIKAN